MPANIHTTTPAEAAEWPAPNHVDPVRRTWIVPFAIVFQVVAVACVVSRLYVRLRMRRDTAGVDDVFIVLALVFAVAFTACTCLELAQYGVDRHTWDVDPSLYPHAAMMTWVTFIVSLCSICCTKVSVLLLYRRILAPSCKQVWNFAVWAAIGVTAVLFVAVILALCLVCDPLWAYWMSFDLTWEASWHCADAQWLNYFVGIVSVISDFYAIVLPLAVLGHAELHISWKQRWTTYFFFLLSISVVAAGIGRTYWLVELGLRPDTSWTGGDLLIWCIAEVQLTIICACAPAIRLVFISARRHSVSFGRQYLHNKHGSYDNQDSHDKPQDGFVALSSMKSAQTIEIVYQPEARTVV